MTQSGARRYLSRLTEQLGTDGVLVVPKDRRAEEPSLPADAVHRRPPCECGHSPCPDSGPKDPKDPKDRTHTANPKNRTGTADPAGPPEPAGS
ncbi:hypothetical protein OG875_14710 [Streptomyces sp. NBC_01498]|uniref:hypothetical protein n=1 Tax=Streptomyces sp. NBC_01498 TaxID=2975870 RepID=UPI002E7B2997|nr:hypothetical protein [Streptomyces sp. NBC_01498]WTL25741.1 hypothetical protein OG875_14710 [Streptomyces sp. NBC_01498]